VEIDVQVVIASPAAFLGGSRQRGDQRLVRTPAGGVSSKARGLRFRIVC
jgi:hypothetical protein